MESQVPKTVFARYLRKQQTDVELLLWQKLRDRRLVGYKFRRQKPIGYYIVDFICVEKMLVVEIDGGQHNTIKGKKYDDRRTQHLRKQGYNVIRFWDNEVIKEMDEVLNVINRALTSSDVDRKTSPGR